ncbi:hypothetical protein [Ascidiaceihabitans sp.]|uniref:hypothetical protein n=1 Tax=Ascidiaceihabitans sp. TaxID=1872644 RepID=UPI00329691C0
MSSIQDNEAPNVVTETRFRTLMQSGYLAEVLCQSAAYNKSAVWYGVWVIRIIDEDRTFMKLLVPARSMSDKHDEIRIREFKTANGLISFLASMGCTHANVPLQEGGVSTHALPVELLAKDEG